MNKLTLNQSHERDQMQHYSFILQNISDNRPEETPVSTFFTMWEFVIQKPKVDLRWTKGTWKTLRDRVMDLWHPDESHFPTWGQTSLAKQDPALPNAAISFLSLWEKH